MSADVWLELEGSRLEDDVDCPWCTTLPPSGVVTIANTAIGAHAWNLTYNLSPMLYAAGMMPWRSQIGRSARVLAVHLAAVVARLNGDPARFEAMNPENGWGSYDQAVSVMTAYTVGCLTHPGATIGGWL